MNVAKWVLLAILALPFAELAAFVAVAAAIGFAWALLLVVATSLFGGLVLRHAGGNHIARMKMALAGGNISALQADGTGSLVLLAGFLLVIPGFITDALGGLLLLAPLGAALRRGPPRPLARRRRRPRARAMAPGARSVAAAPQLTLA